VFVPRRRDQMDFDCMGDVCNHLLRDPQTLEFIANQRPGGKACFVMVDDETQALARQAGLSVMHLYVDFQLVPMRVARSLRLATNAPVNNQIQPRTDGC
jgi:hypothetical protein